MTSFFTTMFCSVLIAGAASVAQAQEAPKRLTATVNSATQISLKWADASSNEAGFELERSLKANSGFKVIAKLAANSKNYVNSGLTQNTVYHYRVRAWRKKSGVVRYSSYSNVERAKTLAFQTDTQSPSAPQSVSVSVVSQSQINLSYSASSDNVGVAGYRVERCQGASCSNFSQVEATSALSHSSTGLQASTIYRFRVRAVDAAGNLSAYSVVAEGTTQAAPDTQAPSAPQGLSASAVSVSQINVSYSASSDNVGVVGYRVERCQGASCSNFAQVDAPAGLSHSSMGLQASTAYRFRVRAVDAAGNLSGYSAIVEATTQTPADTQAPSVPQNLSASAVSTSQIDISYSASSDNVGVVGYRVERCQGVSCSNFAQVDAPSGLIHSSMSLQAGTRYRFRVRAMDAAGNFSAYSAIAEATTQNPPDTQAPSVPQNLSASAVSSSQINVSYSASTDNVGVVGYRVERCQGASCSSFSQVEAPSGLNHSSSGLSANTLYRFRVRAVDAAGNLSAYSAVAEATTQQVVTTPGGWGPRSSSRMFLTGHSLGDDPLADYLVDVVTKRGDNMAYNEQIIIGSPIRVRTRGGGSSGWSGYLSGKNRGGSSGLDIPREIRNPVTIGAGQRYDTLVILENHNSLAMLQWEDTIGYTRQYHDLVMSANPSARSFFYHTWLGMNRDNPTQWIDYEKKNLVTWECAVSKVNLTIGAAGRSDRMMNLPVSAALVDLVEKAIAGQVAGMAGTTRQKMDMIFVDDVHLRALGAYYVALVNYAAIHGKNPSGVAPPSGSGISAATASALQQIAWDFISAYYSRPNAGVRTMDECRSYVAQTVCPAYWGMQGRPNEAAGCGSYFSNPTTPVFRWPDPGFTPYPLP